jgi:predicted nucleic acid-binding protein
MIPASADAVRKAVQAAHAGRASYWDALIVASAADAECSAILTENLANGDVLFGVRIIHPFAGDSLSPDVEAVLHPR